MPAYTIGEAEPIGAVVMEFNADVIYKSKLRAMLYSGALALVIVGGCTFITMLCLRRLATPFYKKLAYTDMLTGSSLRSIRGWLRPSSLSRATVRSPCLPPTAMM